MKKNVLEKVTVGFRCPMNWEEMSGEGRERFCSKCQKSVTDLSQMTREDAEVFVSENGPGGRACVRLLRDAKGNLVTLGCDSKAGAKKELARKVAVGAVAAGSLALVSCSSTPEDEFPLVGMICLPNEK